MPESHKDTREQDELTALPGRTRAELTRLRAERDVFAAEQERLEGRLAEAEEQLRSATEKDGIDALAQRLELAETTRAELASRVDALEADVATVRQERESLRTELTTCRHERDTLRLRLLDAELVLAAGGAQQQQSEPDRALTAEHRAAEIANELDATRKTISWRVTKPLRAARKKMGKQP